ncbi:MAG: reductive dehalogenase domain-containing protein, partial [Dehalogenimonas sp.]
MSVFHSTVSRREFMKNLGLAGAGLGAAALVAPQFHDLDEMMSAEKAVQKRPWFVKERDFYDPSVEHDWDVINRYDRRWQAQTNRIKSYFSYYGDADKRARLSAEGAAISEARTFQTPGYTLPSRALHAARAENLSWSKSWTGPVKSSTGNYSESKTPEEFGTTKWSGTPEENSRLMNAAMRYYGSVITGFAEFDDVWKNKMMVSYTTRGATGDWKATNGALPSEDESLRYVFEDVDKGYDTPSKKVFPGRKQLYIITTASPVASQFLKA